jgi:hypothetical protein
VTGDRGGRGAAEIVAAEKPREPAHWVGRLAGDVLTMAEQLAAAGVLRRP